jgi:hypothetical protein
VKRILHGGRSFRLRRGKLVEIPPEWVGRVTFEQTRRRRQKDSFARNASFHVVAANGGYVHRRRPLEARGQDTKPAYAGKWYRPAQHSMKPYARNGRGNRDRAAIREQEE